MSIARRVALWMCFLTADERRQCIVNPWLNCFFMARIQRGVGNNGNKAAVGATPYQAQLLAACKVTR